MSIATLSLLGGFELRRASGEAVRLPTRKAEALLAYLALAGEAGATRVVLCGLLWGRASEAGARASLRQTLSLLGKALGRAAIVADGRTAALVPGAIQVDALEFDRCSGAGPDVAVLSRAAELYRGELLAGLGLDEAPFEEWLLAERERRREAIINVCARLIALHSERGAADLAIRAALRLLEIDPLEEIAHRALMRLYAGQGRRAAALRQYQLCLRALRRELGIEPSAETRLLYNELLAEPQAGAPFAPAEPAIPATPLIGRDAEYATGIGLLNRARAGQGRIVAIRGEAGIGKTRLTEELAAAAALAGMRVFSGRCYESQQIFPCAPWIELLRAAGAPGDAGLLSGIAPALRAALSSLFPELAPARSEARGSAIELTESRHVVDGILELVARLAARAPLLLVLEDLHWADEMSLRLLAIAGRRIASSPVAIATTVREEEVPQTPALRRALQDLHKSGVFADLRLIPMSHADTTELVAALSRPGMDEEALSRTAAQAWRVSEGNPFVIVEFMHALGESGGPAAGETPALPASVRDLVGQHVERLPPKTRHLLATAAVAGREFDFALLQRASALSVPEASEALEELVRRQLLHAVGGSFDFVHDRVRQAVDGTILGPVRGRLHLAVGEALEALSGDDTARVCDRLAHHFSRSDHDEKAVAYLTQFGDRSARACAHGLAVATFDEALERLQRGPEPLRSRHRLRLVLRKAHSLYRLGRLPEVLALLLPEQAQVDAAADPRFAGTFHHRLAATFSFLGDYESMARHAERALREASACADSITMGKAHVTLANHLVLKRPEEGTRHGHEAIALLENGAKPWWLGQAYWILGLNLSCCGRLSEGLDCEARALALAEAAGDRWLACSATWAAGWIHLLAGDAQAGYAACRGSLDRAPDAMSRLAAEGMLGLAHVERQEPREAVALLDRAILQTEQHRFEPLHGLYLGFRSQAALQSGDVAGALEFARRGVEQTRQTGFTYCLGWTQRALARALRRSGEEVGAAALLAEAIGTFQSIGAQLEVERTQLELAPQPAAAPPRRRRRTS